MHHTNETYTVEGVDASMPTLQMLLVLVAYIFTPNRSSSPEDEAKLTRPRVQFCRTAARALGHFFIGLLAGATAAVWSKVAWLASGGWVLVPLLYYVTCVYLARQSIVIWIIRLYQLRAPAKIRVKCVLVPSCSEYMVLAIGRYGVVRGVSKGIDRLRRCGPPAQIDYPWGKELCVNGAD